MKIHPLNSWVFMGFHGHLLGTLQVLLFAPCLRPHRAEDRGKIKAQLGGMPATNDVKIKEFIKVPWH